MFKKYLAKTKEIAASFVKDISKRQFFVTSMSAVIMLAVLVLFWNYFILPHNTFTDSPKVSGSGIDLAKEEGGASSTLHQGQEIDDAEKGEDALAPSGEKQQKGETGASVDQKNPEEKQGADGQPEDGLPEDADMSAVKLPLEGRLLRKYGFTFSPVFNDYRFNSGIDIAAEEGTAVKCALDGIVEQVSAEGGWAGNTITVNHGGSWKTVYGNVVSVKAQKGSQVSSGFVLGYLGAGRTGDGKTCSLHLEVLKNGEKADPLEYFDYK